MWCGAVWYGLVWSRHCWNPCRFSIRVVVVKRVLGGVRRYVAPLQSPGVGVRICVGGVGVVWSLEGVAYSRHSWFCWKRSPILIWFPPPVFSLSFWDAQVRLLLRRLLSALVFLHSRHIVHRDIKVRGRRAAPPVSRLAWISLSACKCYVCMITHMHRSHRRQSSLRCRPRS